MTASTLTIRTATPVDAPIITHHRRAMFEDMRTGTHETLDAMDAKFTMWVERKIASDEYIGWLLINAQQTVIAGAGLWLIELPATPIDQSSKRAYVMNVYVEPHYRRQGLARRLMQTVIDWSRANGIRTVALQASDAGRPLYESLGFKATNEMRLVIEGDSRRAQVTRENR